VIRNEAVTVLRLDNIQHNQAAAQAATAIGRVGQAGEASAGQIRAAMRSLPAQFSDVATQLAGGQNPLMILLQQGGQVRDQFGSIGAALRGVGSLISPGSLGVAGVAALGAVLLEAEISARKLRDTLALTNNAAGLTGDRLQAVTDRVAAGSRATVSEAKSMVLALADTGSVSARVLESTALAAQRVADLSGRSGAEVAKDFALMGAGVADWAAEHNKAWNFITAQQYLYIKRLEEQGKAEEAAIYVNKQLIGQLEIQGTNLGYLEGAWAGVKKMASEAWSAMLGFGKADTLGQQLEQARNDLAKVERRLADASNSPLPAGPAGLSVMQREREELRQRVANLQEMQRMEDRNADQRSQRAAGERAKIAKLREAPSDGLKNYNPGLFMGPEYLTPEQQFRAMRAADMAGYDEQNNQADVGIRKRREAQQKMLAELVQANEDANLALIADDQQRAQAQITLERMRLQTQIEDIYGNTPARAEAEAAADAAVQAKRAAVGIKFAKDTALVTREETRDALAAAFRDSKNPLKAFGDALGNIVFQRVTNSLADALLTSVFGPASGGGFNLFGGLLSGLGGLLGGGGPASLLAGATGFGDYNAVAALAGARASGGDVLAGESYLVGERGPEILRMGRQGGTVIPNNAIGGNQVTINQYITLGAGVTPAQFAAGMVQAKEQAKVEVLQILQRDRAA
jgi:hypothetical protein